ncbi:MarR family transcriptional regulator [Clostridium sp. HV4-5-A1G]|uniref:MarR family transcriptional regulator n=1 Tax=Clostridium sp. HV4-5-A1G TaxID=2004595 RepID=UPI001238B06E|nr:MarR family transcriptional regulator [Clostridium sp. HV4-5-A1G]KAA8667201.1 MarR family transcriptional regulator [Clostridium sp. HV4-5-A1G]
MIELIKWISITDRFSKMYLNKELGKLGINSSQHMFILKICEHAGITQDGLYPFVYVNKSNITRALMQLEKKGFIIRIPNNNDKRKMLLYPTEKAKIIYEQINNIEKEWTKILLNEISPEDKELLEKLIKKMGKTSIDYLGKNKEAL